MKARIRLGRVLISVVQILTLAGAAVAVFTVSAYFSMRMAVFGRDVTVPRVVEMEAEPAQEELAPLDLRLEEVGSRHDDLVPEGSILSQNPPPGAKLKRGRKVKVQLSLGPEHLEVPQLIGMPVPRARVLLRQDKLRLGQVAYAYADATEENLVMAQDPPAGVSIEVDGKVDLLVSRGSSTRAWIMPDLIGATVRRARQTLKEGGFQVGNVRVEATHSVPPGRVLRQFPLAGYPVHRDDLISLVVSETGEGPR